MRRATLADTYYYQAVPISIHALREESDSLWIDLESMTTSFQSTLSVRRATLSTAEIDSLCLISIHALREESDLIPSCVWKVCPSFQSTLSVRRATCHLLRIYPRFFDFNPRSPWGERRMYAGKAFWINHISIHALREESDPSLS